MASEATTFEGPRALRDHVVGTLRDHEPDLRAMGVARLWLFGSVARGDGGRRSDIDVLISIPPDQRFSLMDLSGVRVELCEIWVVTPTW